MCGVSSAAAFQASSQSQALPPVIPFGLSLAPARLPSRLTFSRLHYAAHVMWRGADLTAWCQSRVEDMRTVSKALRDRTFTWSSPWLSSWGLCASLRRLVSRALAHPARVPCIWPTRCSSFAHRSAGPALVLRQPACANEPARTGWTHSSEGPVSGFSSAPLI